MRGYYQLTQHKRSIIEYLYGLGKNFTDIAREVRVHRTTISREIRRNSNAFKRYNAIGAGQRTRDRRTNKWDCKRKISGVLEEIIKHLMSEGLSPEQIRGRLKDEGSKWSISHEAITGGCIRFKKTASVY